MRTIVFYDMEFTTWPGALDNDWAEDWQHREVVQIGALRFDLDKMQALHEFDVLVKPVLNPELSDLFIELTGITQKDVNEKGLSFPDAYHLFTTFVGHDKTCCYGWDARVMRENLVLIAREGTAPRAPLRTSGGPARSRWRSGPW